MSLRATVATATLVVTVLALLIAGALLVLTTILDRTTARTAESLESVRLFQDARVALLQYERADDALIEAEFEGALQTRLARAWAFVATDEEARLLEDAERRVAAYIAALGDPSATEAELSQAHQAAYGALKQLTSINVEQAKAAQRDAARWSRRGEVIGIGATVLLVLVAGGLLLWLRGRAFEPVLELGESMERFGRGDHEARAVERGPRELREMCRHFNEMASAIAAQRHAQLAFLAGVAHDLRNPLSTLQMSVVMLLSDRSVCSDANIRQAIERVGRQIRRMDRMVGDFLDGARIEAGVLDLRVEVHDARTIVAEIVELFEGTSAAHPLVVNVPDHEVPVCCDHLRIEQVLTNLISNAIKYSPNGGRVEVALRPGLSELELCVADKGVGISKADQVGLFEPFRRVDLSSEAVPGVGLGLYVVNKIVEAHRGRIELDSTLGEGSTFRVFLPLTNRG